MTDQSNDSLYCPHCGTKSVEDTDKWTVERRAKAGIITFGECSLAEHDAEIKRKLLDQIIVTFSNGDLCVHPETEECLSPEMSCTECYLKYFNSLKENPS
jgi:hypothetical protein